MDTRRFCGPEGAFDYRSLPTVQSVPSDNDATKRRDGRKHDQHRPLFLRAGVILSASGSAYVEQGNTKVVCGVYGPREIPRRADFSTEEAVLACQVRLTPFSCAAKRRPLVGDRDADERSFSRTMGEALKAVVCLHLYPKSQIDVFLVVLESDGASMAAALTCAGLALANAGINMYDVVIGATARRLGDVLLIDPTEREEKVARSRDDAEDDHLLTVGFLPTLEQLPTVLQEGYVAPKRLACDVEALTAAAAALLPRIQQCLIASVKDNKENGP